jgi:hypothetical protein
MDIFDLQYALICVILALLYYMLLLRYYPYLNRRILLTFMRPFHNGYYTSKRVQYKRQRFKRCRFLFRKSPGGTALGNLMRSVGRTVS